MLLGASANTPRKLTVPAELASMNTLAWVSPLAARKILGDVALPRITPPSGAALMLSGPDLASAVTVMAKAKTGQNNAGRKNRGSDQACHDILPL